MEQHFELTRLLKDILNCFSIGIPIVVILRSYFATIRFTADTLNGTMLYKLHILRAALIALCIFSYSAISFIWLCISQAQ